MDFRITHRDGPARRGILSAPHQVTTPAVLFLSAPHLSPPAEAHLTIGTEPSVSPTVLVPPTCFSSHPTSDSYLIYPKDVSTQLHVEAVVSTPSTEFTIIPANIEALAKLSSKPGRIYAVANSSQSASHAKAFVAYLAAVRRSLDPGSLLYVPSMGTPVNLALLAYMGVDLIDSCSALLAARHGALLFPTGAVAQSDLLELPCRCPTCSQASSPADLSFDDRLAHNSFALVSETTTVRNAIAAGNLRELVEMRVRADPQTTAYLRLLDLEQAAFLEEATAVTRKTPLIATTENALVRPDVRRFQQRVLDRYRKPASAKVLLLLPCSAHKPYSSSKSHTLFRTQLMACGNPWVVHEVIVTSPLGLVPRELEIVPPAASYDITVTGHWSEDEAAMIRRLLQTYLATNAYDTIIAHLDRGLSEIVSSVAADAASSCVGSPTSEASLQRLGEVLQETTARYPRVSAAERAVEEMAGVAAYQFGRPCAQALLASTTVRGRYPYRKLLTDHEQLGMITPERGLLSLTLDGGRRLQSCAAYWVRIADDFTLIGSVFAPGVVDADPGIRIGDDVVILQKGSLVGVGVAAMNGHDMVRGSKGEAVKVRHRVPG